MPFFLKNRRTDLVELMDRDDCDQHKLENTYRQFYRINGILSQWRRIYTTQLRPLMQDRNREFTLLDIGFGGGDIPFSLAKWAQNDGLNLKITAIELDERALDFVSDLEPHPKIEFKHCSSTQLVLENRTFDFVISNHVLHHLDTDTFSKFLDEAISLAGKKVIFNDIERSDVGYVLFNLFSRLLFRNSFITQDGLTSVKRSFTFSELKHVIPEKWNTDRLFPFRLILSYTKDA